MWAHNAQRQLWVNNIADHKVGSGTGTADWHGVPGTKLGPGVDMWWIWTGIEGFHGNHGQQRFGHY